MDATLSGPAMPSLDLLERLFGRDLRAGGWTVELPANDDDPHGELHPAFIQALLKRRRSW